MLSKKLIQKKIRAIIQKIKELDVLYYSQSKAKISDTEYDFLKQRLQKLEKKYPEFFTKNSPTQYIGDDRIAGFTRYIHKIPMQSLNNCYNEKELRNFDKRLCNSLCQENLEYIVEPKIDGIAINLIYERGKLIRAITRGNGIEGDDVTRNFMYFVELPQYLTGSGWPSMIEIRGEIYIKELEFKRINFERKNKGLSQYSNPRNLTAGVMKLINIHTIQKINLNLIVYSVGHYVSVEKIKFQFDFYEKAKKWQLPIADIFWSVYGINTVLKCIKYYNNERLKLPYPTDGIVVKLNNLNYQNKIGCTAKAPRWAIAFKFKAKKAITMIKDIVIQISRTGILTPIAILNSVWLDGTKVSRATLHNANEIIRKDIRIGDYVVIEKAGEIIPFIIKSLTEKRDNSSKPYLFTTICPACGTDLIRFLNEVAWRCPNYNCLPQVQKRLLHFSSCNAMNIKNLGISCIKKITKFGLIKDIADIYSLKFNNLIILDNFAEISIRNLLNALEKSKKQPLWRLIYGLGIEHIGIQASKEITKSINNLDQLINTSVEKILEINGIGKIMANSVYNFFKNSNNLKILKKLKQNGINDSTNKIDIKNQNTRVQGKIFVFTGTLKNLSRQKATRIIEVAGGVVCKSISKKTDYLITGESSGSKIKKADILGTKQINENQFFTMFHLKESYS